MADALEYAFYTGLAVACLGFIVAWVVLILDFRGQVLAARMGSFTFNKDKVNVADASNYFGIQISNSAMTYCLLVIAVSLGAFPVYWSVARNLIMSFWKTYLIILSPVLINLVFKKVCPVLFTSLHDNVSRCIVQVVGYCIVTSSSPYPHIRYRRLYHVYDLIQMFIQLYTGSCNPAVGVRMLFGAHTSFGS